MSKSGSISVPIKSIIEHWLKENDANYSDEMIMSLRCYGIALLNLRFIQIEQLHDIIDRITSAIKRVVYLDNLILNKLDHYRIVDQILYIDIKSAEPDTIEYDITIFKAFTQVLIEADDKRLGFSNAICEMIAERVWKYKLKEAVVIMPCLQREIINGIPMQTLTGYRTYDVIINLLLMYFYANDINCDNIFRRMMKPNSNYNKVLEEITDSFTANILLNQLDEIALKEIRRKGIDNEDSEEANNIREFQKDIFYMVICGNEKLTDIQYRNFIDSVMEQKLKSFFLKAKPLAKEQEE